MMESLKQALSRWRVRAAQWSALTFYQRFESVVAFALTLLITLVIVVALSRLVVGVVGCHHFDTRDYLLVKARA